MGFEEFLPQEEAEDEEDMLIDATEASVEKIGHNQFYDMITSRKPDWQSIIYDMIHADQLDPWDIDIVKLTNRYFEKVFELEESGELESNEEGEYEEPDFYASSKVLLAAALLLRIKSEFLLNKHLKSIDEILFGRKDDQKNVIERIEIDEDELPILIPKTPLPRARKVTLPELMAALNKAINTESRRIKREVAIKRAKKLSEVDIPAFKRIDLKDRIKQFYARILTNVKKNTGIGKVEKHLNKIGYSNLIGKEREERLACFLPLLHLSNSKKLWLEQEDHLEEIWIYLYEFFSKNQTQFIEELEEDIEEMKEELGEGHLLEKDAGKTENIDEAKTERIEAMKKKKNEKKQMVEDIAKELEEELGIINKDEKIKDITGFNESIE